jgi:hypothetical protein
MSNPRIILHFEDEFVEWRSVFWADNEHLMKLAKLCVSQGDNPTHVIQLLEAAGFEVLDMTERKH